MEIGYLSFKTLVSQEGGNILHNTFKLDNHEYKPRYVKSSTVKYSKIA